MTKGNAEYQRIYKKKMRDMGLTQATVWIHPSNKERLKKVAQKLLTPYQ